MPCLNVRDGSRIALSRSFLTLDEASLDHVRQELIFKQLARDAHGEGLEWVGSWPRRVETDGRPATPTGVTDEIVSAPSDEVPMLPAAPIRPPLRRERLAVDRAVL